MINELILRIF